MQPRVPPMPQKADDKPEELQFINLTNNYSSDPSLKKIVRKHVMSKYRRDQRKGQVTATPNRREPAKKSKSSKSKKAAALASSSSSSQLVPVTWIVEESPPSGFQQSLPSVRRARPNQIHDTDAQDDTQENDSQKDVQLLQLPRILGAGRIDPLNTLPIKNSYSTCYLIDHFNQFINWRKSQLPNTLFANFFHLALTDEALAHALMIYAANHDQFITGRPRTVDIIYHHNEAVKILRSRVNESAPNISDESIVTICGLVIFEEMFGSSEIASTHRAGLQRAVELRGGMCEIGHQLVSVPFVIQALKSPASVTAWENAYTNGPTYSGPYLTPPPQTPSPRPYSSSPKISVVTPKTYYLSTCECPEYHPPHPPSIDGWDEIMKEIINTRLKDSAFIACSPLHTKHRLPIHNESYLVESRVGTLIEGFETEDITEKDVKVVYGKSWLLGCRIFLYTVLRCNEKRPVKSKVLQGLVSELRQSLEGEFQGYSKVYESFDSGGTASRFHEKYYSPNVLLWVLLIGGTNATALALNTWSKISRPFPSSPALSPSTTEMNHSKPPQELQINFSATNADSAWFQAATAQLCSGLGIREWDGPSGVKSRMVELPWVEWKIERDYRGFWERARANGGVAEWTVFKRGY